MAVVPGSVILSSRPCPVNVSSLLPSEGDVEQGSLNLQGLWKRKNKEMYVVEPFSRGAALRQMFLQK